MSSKLNTASKPIGSPSVSAKQPSRSRRTVLKKILVSTGMTVGATALPGQWVKPVVNRVLVPAHAQTSPVCECQMTKPGVIGEPTNTFSVSYSWSNCENIHYPKLEIAGTGVDDEGLTYSIFPPVPPSGSTDFNNTSPYNDTVFIAGETYTFTLTLHDEDDMVIQTCVETVVALQPG